MFIRTWVDQVDLQVVVYLSRTTICCVPATRHKPEVDIVGSEVSARAQRTREFGEVFGGGGEGGAFEEEEGRGRGDGAEEDNAASGLVCGGGGWLAGSRRAGERADLGLGRVRV